MAFDFSFTKDPDWIRQREILWKEWEQSNSEGLTKKKLDAFRSYFMTGEINAETQKTATVIFDFCPSYEREAFEFVAREYVDPRKAILWERKYFQINADFVLNLDSWIGATREKKMELFRMVYGYTYDPKRKFPFRFKGEADFRDLAYDANGLQMILMNCFVLACYSERGEELPPQLEFDEYITSVFPFVDSWLLSRSLTEEQKCIPMGGADAGHYSYCLTNLMKYASGIFPDFVRQGCHFEYVQEKLLNLRDYFDQQNQSKELQNMWRAIAGEAEA